MACITAQLRKVALVRAYTGFTVALNVFCRELTVTRLSTGWKITWPILDRAVSYVTDVVDWTGIMICYDIFNCNWVATRWQ